MKIKTNLQSALDVQDLNFLYNDQIILKNVSFSIDSGNLVAVVGPNGAGKTTLLKSIVGLNKPISGSITFFGYTFERYRKKIAYVPQRLTVDWDFPVSVFDVVMMGRYCHLGWFKRPGRVDHDRVYEALDQVGLISYKDRHIGALSGGQQQRVFLARALVQDAHIYLMDEPFVGVDITTEKMIVNLLKNLRKEGKTVIVVHHDVQTLSEYFDTVLLLNVGVVGYGPVHQMILPEYMCVAYGKQIV